MSSLVVVWYTSNQIQITKTVSQQSRKMSKKKRICHMHKHKKLIHNGHESQHDHKNVRIRCGGNFTQATRQSSRINIIVETRDSSPFNLGGANNADSHIHSLHYNTFLFYFLGMYLVVNSIHGWLKYFDVHIPLKSSLKSF